MRRFLLCLLLVLCSAVAFAQQEYVSRFDAFGSYSYLTSPKLNLVQRGFNGQFGVNMRRWVALGVDYSIFKGHSSLTLGDVDTNPATTKIPPPLLVSLGQIAALDPTLAVPYNATTWSFAAGPQFNMRKFKYITLFVHPDLGVMHESVIAKPNGAVDPFQVIVVTGLEQGGVLTSSGGKTDTAMFWGGAGGIDLNVSKHMHIRAAVDVVHVFLFKGFLADPRNAVRISVGPTFDFGKNVK